jgi:hypothetical protein
LKKKSLNHHKMLVYRSGSGFLVHQVNAACFRPLECHEKVVVHDPIQAVMKQLEWFLGLMNSHRPFLLASCALLTNALRASRSSSSSFPPWLPPLSLSSTLVAANPLVHQFQGVLSMAANASKTHMGAIS